MDKQKSPKHEAYANTPVHVPPPTATLNPQSGIVNTLINEVDYAIDRLATKQSNLFTAIETTLCPEVKPENSRESDQSGYAGTSSLSCDLQRFISKLNELGRCIDEICERVEL